MRFQALRETLTRCPGCKNKESVTRCHDALVRVVNRILVTLQFALSFLSALAKVSMLILNLCPDIVRYVS